MLHSTCRLLALPANVKPSLKCLAETNTLAYFASIVGDEDKNVLNIDNRLSRIFGRKGETTGGTNS